MTQEYDLIVIGTDTAAPVAAYGCRAAGWRVAVIDHLPIGGTCALRGCDPKKVLVGAAETLDQVSRLRGKGVGGGEPAVDWPAFMAFKRSFTAPVPQSREEASQAKVLTHSTKRTHASKIAAFASNMRKLLPGIRRGG
jgi:glutathione reductase (NADPH)